MTDQPTETAGIGGVVSVVVVVAAGEVVVGCDVADPGVVEDIEVTEVEPEPVVHAPINATSTSTTGL
jgi:hypothetical protein